MNQPRRWRCVSCCGCASCGCGFTGTPLAERVAAFRFIGTGGDAAPGGMERGEVTDSLSGYFSGSGRGEHHGLAMLSAPRSGLVRSRTLPGAPTLAELIGDDIVTKVCEWLGLGRAMTNTIPFHRSRGGGLVKQLSDEISTAEKFAQDQSGELYRFHNGVYVPDGERHVKRLVKTLLEKRNETQVWSSNRAKEVVEYLRVDSPLLWERPSLDVINVRNGLLDVTTGELKPHSPEFLSPAQLPVSFNASAKCPAWEKFVVDVFPKDAQELAWDIPAWLMTPDTSIQKAILLVGEGANGKSVYLAGLRTFLGRTNVASETLHRLESNRFAVAQLVGKLANICPDFPVLLWRAHRSLSSLRAAIASPANVNSNSHFHSYRSLGSYFQPIIFRVVPTHPTLIFAAG